MSTRRRTTRPRRRVARRNNNMHTIARQEARKVVNRNVESKMWDGSTARAVDYTGSVFRVFENPAGATAIAQSTTDNGYIGSKVKVMYLTGHFQVVVGDTTNVITLVVFQDRGSFAPADMTNVFQQVGTSVAPLSMPNRAFNERFRILYRKTVALNSVGTSNRILTVKLKPNKFRYPVCFSNTTGTAESGDIYFGTISDSAAVTHPSLDGAWRVYYKDA